MVKKNIIDITYLEHFSQFRLFDLLYPFSYSQSPHKIPLYP